MARSSWTGSECVLAYAWEHFNRTYCEFEGKEYLVYILNSVLQAMHGIRKLTNQLMTFYGTDDLLNAKVDLWNSRQHLI